MDDPMELKAFNGYYNTVKPMDKHLIRRPPS